ncbi:transposase [Thiomicrorhabdus sp. Milos-T2]|uniref:transposase n=1 Tax=Thiomicrorhabdus sp. Milos-T2 TaxID=90814 RepID=UPI00068DA133|nr:transposase [Thiomicrorhabdus sp. Milos-T2]
MRKTLVHFSELDTFQFVTFRTQASIEDYQQRLNLPSNLNTSHKQTLIDEYCDKSFLGRDLNDVILDELMLIIQALEPDFYHLIAVSIMPNHVHLLFQQKQTTAKIMQKLKGSSALMINRALERQGHFWEKSYFDKAIRNQKHFELTYEYIKNNAIKAGLKDAEQRFWGLYETEDKPK